MRCINNAKCGTLATSLCVGHLVTQPLRKPCAPSTTSSTSEAAPPFSTPSALLCLLPLVTFCAVRPIIPASDIAQLLVEDLLVLLNQCVDFVGQDLRELLRSGQVDAVEDNNASGLVE